MTEETNDLGSNRTLEEHAEEPEQMSRRGFWPVLAKEATLWLGGTAGASYGLAKAGEYAGEKVGEGLVPPIKAVEGVVESVDILLEGFGISGYDVDEFRDVIADLDTPTSPTERLIHDTYQEIVRRYDMLDHAIDETGKKIASDKRAVAKITEKYTLAERRVQRELGVIADYGIKLKEALAPNLMRKVDETIIDIWSKTGLLDKPISDAQQLRKMRSDAQKRKDTAQKEKDDLHAQLTELHNHIRDYEERVQDLNRIKRNYEDLMKHVHNVYVTMPNVDNATKKGALEFMLRTSIEHYDAVTLQTALAEEDYMTLGKYKGRVLSEVDTHAQIMELAKEEYKFEPDKKISEQIVAGLGTAGKYVGAAAGILAGLYLNFKRSMRIRERNKIAEEVKAELQ